MSQEQNVVYIHPHNVNKTDITVSTLFRDQAGFA